MRMPMFSARFSSRTASFLRRPPPLRGPRCRCRAWKSSSTCSSTSSDMWAEKLRQQGLQSVVLCPSMQTCRALQCLEQLLHLQQH